MKTTTLTTFEKAAAMPAATWHFLDMNDTRVEIPEGFALAADVAVSGAIAQADSGAFTRALEDAQVAWEQTHPDLTEEEKAELEAYWAAEADATYGGTAQSDYQIGADAIEAARSLAVAFEHGTGEEVAAYVAYAAGERNVIHVAAGKSSDAQIIVKAHSGAVSTAAIDIIAEQASNAHVSIVVDGPDEADDEADGNAHAQADVAVKGIAGTTVRVFAGEDARVSIARMQTLDEGYMDIDDMGLFSAERSRIDVTQTVLGAQSTFTGLAGDLRGDASEVNVNTHYLGHGTQAHDFNYVLRHHGRVTKCNLMANGVLAGSSSKVLRGTIDLIRGCKGAEGQEAETVLLVDDGVRNKTVPTILCNEDDVAGNHGATIGHIRDEQMFYLASRGLSRDAAEHMFVSAIMEQAAIDASDEAARAGVVRLGERISPGFAALFDGDL